VVTSPQPDYAWVAVGDPAANEYDVWVLDTSGNIWAISNQGSVYGVSGPHATEIAMFNETISCDGGTMHTPWVVTSNNEIYRYSTTTSCCTCGSFSRITELGSAAGGAHITTEYILGPAGNLFEWSETGTTFGAIVAPPPSGHTLAGIAGTTAGPWVSAWDTVGNVYNLN
jgi:hypothetical protein